MTYFDHCVIVVLIICSYKFGTMSIDVEKDFKSI